MEKTLEIKNEEIKCVEKLTREDLFTQEEIEKRDKFLEIFLELLQSEES